MDSSDSFVVDELVQQLDKHSNSSFTDPSSFNTWGLVLVTNWPASTSLKVFFFFFC